jgi:type III restriction enzyme
MTSLRKEATVFHDHESLAFSEERDQNGLLEIMSDDSPYPRSADREIDNKFWFRSPVNVVLTTHAPGREFTKRLFEPGIVEKINSWIKSPDTGFYEISYSWRKGDHTKQGKFNPDYFIAIADARDVLVIELKANDDDSDENKAKLRYATAHFERVNEAQDDAMYHMKFVSPVSYDAFFQAMKDGTAASFESELQALLLE